MADVSTVQVGSTTYNLVDPGAARSGHTHTFASSTHVHYMTSQNTITGTALGAPNTTYNTSTAGYFCAWGCLGTYNIGYTQKGTIAVPAYGNLSTNIHIWTISAAKAKPWVNIPLHGRSYSNYYQLNTDGKLYLMSLNGRGSQYNQSGMLDDVQGVGILSYGDDAWLQTTTPSAVITGS